MSRQGDANVSRATTADSVNSVGPGQERTIFIGLIGRYGLFYFIAKSCVFESIK